MLTTTLLMLSSMMALGCALVGALTLFAIEESQRELRELDVRTDG